MLPRGKPRFSYLKNAEADLRMIVADHHDATLAEFCELFANKTGNWVGKSAMCSALQKLGLNRKKADALRSGLPTMEAHQEKRFGAVKPLLTEFSFCDVNTGKKSER